ncbi:MAG: 1-acyl-sn-glycerol-3-phosphate acyltransferase [Alphaproteobacteria bacterium]|jgi:1-acyl-sn-glycerol-3-phosphate acyltransferase|nr:1-acyl-sn-glycerol-3-phosphate acyltransferase [Alphaproteobacteria bacterium]
MKHSWPRSILFNIAFFGVTLAMCVLYIPLLILPRPLFTGMVRLWIYVVTFLEHTLLGLSYEVRGREHLPKDGAFIVAAKHQSPYETIKLRILLSDPAIILKKELLSIPLWGWYLKKSGVIAIDRGTPERALKSIERGGVQMAEAGRPIVIFVQGTRVRPEETPSDKPYKSGIARIQEATKLPIIPMALNSGLFWPRGGWLKSPGKVVFEFFPPIAPGKHRKELMRELQDKIEAESSKLMNEARAVALAEEPAPLKKAIGWAVTFAVLFAGYSWAWSFTSKKALELYVAFLKDVVETERIHAEPVVSGYPGPVRITVAEDSVRSSEGSLRIENLVMSAWPLPWAAVHVKTGTLTVHSHKWSQPLAFDSLEAWVGYNGRKIKIHDSYLNWRDFEGSAKGTIDLRQEPVPKVEMNVLLTNFSQFIGHLAELGILKHNEALFMNAGLSLMASGSNQVGVPITQNGQTLYAGPLPVASLPVARPPEQHNWPDQAQ